MSTAVTEAARVINPLSASIANGIMKAINRAIDLMNASTRTSREKAIEQLAYSLKLEYPKESDEYVMNLAIQMYKENEDV